MRYQYNILDSDDAIYAARRIINTIDAFPLGVEIGVEKIHSPALDSIAREARAIARWAKEAKAPKVSNNK